jgi:phosphoglycolate phosphatase-like HAD superfamily hydrolase
MKLFVWDLHGVLETGNDRAVVDISNEVLRQFGHPERFTYENGVELYGRKWYEYFERLLPDVSHDHRLSLQDACFQLTEFNLTIQRRWLTRTVHAWEVLTAISHLHHQILISNTRSDNLELFLKTLQLERFFPDPSVALAVDGHSQDVHRTKTDVLSDYLAGERTGDSYEEIVIIGDSPSDMRLRDVAGGVTYLYAHPKFSFRDCVADFRIRDLRAVLDRV